ncbi:hypothetical protein F5X68DRAFT_10709 [Plectosphaerella plurivora]|uniref:Filamentation protein n=1 Tax=Plectosphaerella plurivora TaxID=936078 RepID=A0A9P9ACU3_9PEZI|nr:hypothetical protein F5X68DRAFT_10709 [Plectosphaerella plurivora]
MPDPVKAAHYIQALDAARVEGNWSTVPEFVRKIRKHAPDRECLALTAEIEHSISTVSKAPTASSSASTHRPSTAATAATTATSLDTATQLPKLLSIINKEDKHPQDVYQAKVCLGWLHWTVDEYGLAAVRLPTHLDYEQLQAATSGKLSDWTSVCALKAAYLKADCLSVEGQRAEALTVFETALPALMPIWDTRSSGKQLRYCSELFLTEFCMMHSRFLQSGQTTLHDTNSLGCFRAWAKYWDIHGGSALGGHGFRGSVPRRRVWSEYYAALSTILDRDMPLPSGFKPVTPAADTSGRNQLRIELKKAEAAYEALLIAETRFPRADEQRDEVEDFVRGVVANWAILCGRGWREQDLGPGGREGTSRAVIDLLYRAATRTYHSTGVLRSLFTVHLAVSEFDLAFKAFDSYLDLIRHGKARVDKSGHAEAGLDDDATVLETISHCILALCRYGGRDAIEKARDLGSELEDWLARLPQLRATVAPTDPKALPEVAEETVDAALHPEIPPSIVALSWQAIGLSQAHWTRVTYDAGLRTEIQAKAVRCLRKALSPELGRTRDVRTLFALGLLLAEKRELTSAIDIVKTALISNKAADEDTLHYNGPFWQERSLIPLWHLLALLLSARQEFMTAARACEGAFEQFRDTSVLFGDSGGYKSDHLNELAGKTAEDRKGLVDELEDFERESILEIKMTQLTLVELLEGPDVAVNASFELLSLFSRLFGDVQPKKQAPTATNATGVPQSSAGTLRSIKGSIFGSRSDKAGRTVEPPVLENQASTTTTDRPQTTQTTASGAPTIQVTGENGNTTEGKTSRRLSNQQRRSRSNSGKRNSVKKRESSSSRHRPPSLGDATHSPTVVDGDIFFTPMTELSQPPLLSPVGKKQAGLTFSREHTLSHAASYMSQASKSTVQSFSEVSPDATYTITAPLPIVQFPQEQVRRHRVGILVKVWLMIAGFYRRAEMYEDAKGAVAEAQKLVQGLDQERDASTNPSGRSGAWAERKSLDELWGDLWAELGSLSLAEGLPYKARAEFESALTHFPDHPAATVGLADILLDVYTEKIVPEPTVPSLTLAEDGLANLSLSPDILDPAKPELGLASTPIGLGRPGFVTSASSISSRSTGQSESDGDEHTVGEEKDDSKLPPPYKASSVPLLDRLAARDRASGLLTGLTKLGAAWDYSEAWFTLARAHEESGLVEKAKEVLWWCVELEEGRGVREWRCLAGGGYVL